MEDYMSDAGAEFGAEFGASDRYDGIVVGIPETAIATGVTTTITIQVTQPFRAERLILGGLVLAGETLQAQALEVEQISISSEDQNRGDGPVPGDLFSADATHRLRGTIVQPGVGIRLTLSNPTAATITARGAFFGPAQVG